MVPIQLRNIDPSYLRFLRAFDPHVPLKDDRPWLWPVRLSGIDYGIPLTTQDTAAGYIGYIRCGTVPENGLYLRYMIPVPYSALLPARPLSDSLKQELRFYEECRNYIEAEVQILRRLSESKRMDRLFLSHCCDYAELESVYFNWVPGFDAGPFLYPNKEVEQTMPISKNGVAYFTKEQLVKAQSYVNALEYAQQQGYEMIRENHWYRMKDHDSLVFYPDGKFIWNSRGVSGGVLNFMIYYENKTMVDAVLTLAGDEAFLRSRPTTQKPIQKLPTPVTTAPATKTAEDPPKVFRLPSKDENNRKIFYYLCRIRGLEKQVVQEMIRQGLLYQSGYQRPTDKKVLTNVTFVYRDPEGKAVGAFQRGMIDKEGIPPYKRDVSGTDKSWGWLLQGAGTPDTVAVFEGAIDAASEASLSAMKDGDVWKSIDRLSMEGISGKGLWIDPLKNYLQTRTRIRKVMLMYDADSAGRAAAAATVKWLQTEYPQLEVESRETPFGKDWNEVLTQLRAMEAERLESSPSPAPMPEI